MEKKMSYNGKYNIEDFLRFLGNSGYGSAMEKRKKQYEDAAAMEDEETALLKKQVKAESDEQSRQAYVNYLSQAKKLPEAVSKSGLNGGGADSLRYSLMRDYQNSYNGIQSNRSESNLKLDLGNRQAKNDLYKSYVTDDGNLYQKGISDYLDWKNTYDDSYSELSKQLSYAEELAKHGNYTLLSQLTGMDEKDLKKQYEATPDTDTREDPSSQLKYAESLAKYGNYTALARLVGISAEELKKYFTSSSDSPLSGGTSGGGVGNSNYSNLSSQIKAAEELAKYGNYSLLSQATGISEKELKKIYEEKYYSEIDATYYKNYAAMLETAEQLAKFGNYSLLSELTGVSSSNLKKVLAPVDNSVSPSQVYDAAKLFMNGDRSYAVKSVLYKAYPNYSLEQIWKLWESTAAGEWEIDVRGGYVN